jgi:type I restriction enzyme M protein
MSKRHRPGRSAARVLSHVEEIVLATSGADPFEIVFALAAARVAGNDVRKKHPELAITSTRDASAELLARVDALLGEALSRGDRYEALDAVFESLVPRVAKGEKGQFFTPRHVVDFVVRALALRAKETVVDPACGSGAFLAHARAHANVKTFGCDLDVRAVRVARLLALAAGGDPNAIARGDGLRTRDLPAADVVATNPPFAGRTDAEGFAVARIVRTPERDVLFLERALELLVPGGRLGIVLPYNKAAGQAFAALRKWLVERARLLAVVGLPRETFLPHTSQRTFVLFAQRRREGESPRPRERTMLALSERAGKDSAGEPDGPNDLAELEGDLFPFLRAEGFVS